MASFRDHKPVSMLHGPAARAVLLRGMEQMTRLLRPTLGPVARTVVVASILGNRNEVLDSGATIARRTIELPDPFEDMGAMIVRHLAWRVHETAGDGSATAAVLATALMAEANRVIEAGNSPVMVRRGIEEAVAIVRAQVQAMARPIDLPEEIAAIVLGTVRDEKIAQMIGDVVDGLGEDGSAVVENAHGTETDYQYIEGIHWNEGWHSPSFLKRTETTARLIDPRILITDTRITEAAQILPAMEACVAAGEKAFFVVAPELSESALSVLLTNRDRGVIDTLAVKAPTFGAQRTGILEDLAIATGGRCFREEVGESIATATLADLGRARQAWSQQRAFGVLGGQGNRDTIRARLMELRAELASLEHDDWRVKRMRERIGKLSGSEVVIIVGAPSEAARDELKLRVETAITLARSALRDGVVPGGGATFLACAVRLTSTVAGRRDEEAIGWRALARALEAPMQAISANAGLDGRATVAAGRAQVPELTYDVLRRAWADPWEAGILDSAGVLAAALDAGVSAAAAALTSEVLIHRPDAPNAKAP